MTGRFRRCSTVTPWAFMATSMLPFAAPSTASAAISSGRPGARKGGSRVSMHRTAATQVTRWLPWRAVQPPVRVMLHRLPRPMARRAAPICASLRFRASRMLGMFTAQVANSAPLIRKMTLRARRAASPGRSGDGGWTGVLGAVMGASRVGRGGGGWTVL